MSKTGTDNSYRSFLSNIRIPIWLTIAAVVTFILILAFTVNHARERDIVEQFSQQQIAIASGTAAGIEELISSVEKSMIILSRLPCVTGVLPETTTQSIKVIYDNLDGKVEFIAVKNMDGVVTAKYPSSVFEEINDQSLKFAPYFKEIQKTGRAYIGDLHLRREGETENKVHSVIVAVPTYDTQETFSGVVFTSLSLSAIIDRYIKATSDISGCGWIIDNSGAILVRPDKVHACMEPETLGNTQTVDGVSLKDILAEEKEGYNECMLPTEGKETKKSIIAYAPVNAGSGRWFVAITTPYNKIVLLARRGFLNIILWTLGLIIVVIITGISITYLGVRRLRLEEELKRLREREEWQEKLLREYKTTEGIIAGSPIPTFVLNREHRVILWNRACSELTGIQAEDMIGTDNHSIPFYKKKRPALADIIVEHNIDALKQYYSTKSIKKSATVKGAYEARDYIEDLGGKDRHIYFLAAPIYDGKGEIIAAMETIQDVTPQKKLEQKFYESQKLAAIGQLSAGIAHEVRNPLSSIKMSLQILEKRMRPEGNDSKRFKIARREVEHLEKLVNDILIYARPSGPRKQLENIQNILDHVLAMTEKSVSDKHIRVEMDIAPDLPPLIVDPAMVEQAFLNVCRNAIDAMEDGGTISISAGKTDGRISVEFRDNGCGIASEDMPHIFNPFFTKKKYGTGLGLTQIKKITDLHKGTITVSSNEGEGTSVVMTFPIKTAQQKGKRQYVQNSCNR